MSQSPPSPGRTGRPPLTSRAQILSSARALIDRDGWERLTIRRLATEAGVGATTIYHHVRDKEDLLVQLLNDVAEQLPQPVLPEAPRDRIVVAATAIHDALATWPWAAEVLTADGFIARLGGRAVGLVETIVAGAVDAGCTSAQAVDVFRSIWYYTVGEILVRAHSPRPTTGGGAAGQANRPFFSNLDPAKQPHLAALGDQWPALAARDIYPDGLSAFVDGLLAQARGGRDVVVSAGGG